MEREFPSVIIRTVNRLQEEPQHGEDGEGYLQMHSKPILRLEAHTHTQTYTHKSFLKNDAQDRNTAANKDNYVADVVLLRIYTRLSDKQGGNLREISSIYRCVYRGGRGPLPCVVTDQGRSVKKCFPIYIYVIY